MYGRDWRWKSLIKCNVDVRLFFQQRCYGIGISVHDKNGEYRRAKTMYIDIILAPQGNEAAGLLHALTNFVKTLLLMSFCDGVKVFC